VEIKIGNSLAAGLSYSCRGYRFPDRSWNPFYYDPIHPLETPFVVTYAHRDFHFHILRPGKRGGDRLICFGQSKHGKLLLSPVHHWSRLHRGDERA
jgi:hypothetical protein